MLPRRGQPKSLFRISSFFLITAQKTDGLAKQALSACDMHHIRARNAPYHGLIKPISGPETGSFAKPWTHYRIARLRKPLSVRQIAKSLKTREFASEDTPARKYLTLVELTMNKYATAAMDLHIYAMRTPVLYIYWNSRANAPTRPQRLPCHNQRRTGILH